MLETEYPSGFVHRGQETLAAGYNPEEHPGPPRVMCVCKEQCASHFVMLLKACRWYTKAAVEHFLSLHSFTRILRGHQGKGAGVQLQHAAQVFET
jgi:hypothetical protein